MKTTIYYFSATGNSLYTAKLIAAKLEDCTLVSIPNLRHNPALTAETDAIGFVFPTHYFGLPPIVSYFIDKIKVMKAKYTFAVVTSGSSSQLNSSLHQLDSLLRKKDLTLDAGFHVMMISTYIPLSNIPPIEKVNQRLDAAEQKIQQIAADIIARKSTRDSENFWLPFKAINNYWKNQRLADTHRKFSCSAACTSCGTCEKVCPVGNIRLENGKPHWSDHCQECLACLHLCPAKSIEFGTRTKGRSRYHHPKVALSEIVKQNIIGTTLGGHLVY